ncbi:hypothetical protein IAU60_006404 [Kwoniella sp. DSM 27419]
MSGSNSRAPTNPFYSSNPTSPPPSYSASRPAPSGQNHGEPMQYTSLSDLSRGRAAPPPPRQQFSYQPQPERQGYRSSPPVTEAAQGGRRVPPMPQDGMMPNRPPEPPRRNVATPPMPPRQPGMMAQVQGYIPDRAANTVTTAADRVKDGFNSFATTERKDQVMSGLGRLGVGAAKLTAKGAYQIGKFASK